VVVAVLESGAALDAFAGRLDDDEEDDAKATAQPIIGPEFIPTSTIRMENGSLSTVMFLYGVDASTAMVKIGFGRLGKH
jgi:hypothetical protein